MKHQRAKAQARAKEILKQKADASKKKSDADLLAVSEELRRESVTKIQVTGSGGLQFSDDEESEEDEHPPFRRRSQHLATRSSSISEPTCDDWDE